MSAVLSPEWFEKARSALVDGVAAGAVSAVVQYVVSASPDGKVTFHVTVDQGSVTDLVAAKAIDADVTVSCSYDGFTDLIDGSLSPDVAYMDATLKVEGDHKLWLIDLREVREQAFVALRSIS